MKYLVSTTEVYRFDTEEAAKDFIEDAKSDSLYSLNKYTCEYKERKAKGEIVDSWYKVTLIKAFNNEKEPDTDIDISYESRF